VWIATPLGVLRFSDARIDLAVPGSDADRLNVAVVTGQAIFVPAAGVVTAVPSAGHTDAGAVAASGPIALAPGVTLEASRPAGGVARWARDVVAACVRQAVAARDAGKLVASPQSGGGASPGNLAFAHIRARQLARAACESAWAASALAPGLLDPALRADLEGADATWKGSQVSPSHPSSGTPTADAE
jgi:hypothetical protein